MRHETPNSAALQPADASASISSTPAFASQQEQQQEVDDALDGFTPAASSRRKAPHSPVKPQGSPSRQASGASEQGSRVSAKQASLLVEQAAAGTKGHNRLRLWREWLTQVSCQPMPVLDQSLRPACPMGPSTTRGHTPTHLLPADCLPAAELTHGD